MHTAGLTRAGGPSILAAAKTAGVDAVYKCGGAQAIAAMAYGTESIPRVYKIVGPGNIYVATAKRRVFGQVDIDMIAGPSDVLVLADSKAEPRLIAADMLAQAEHDTLASAVLVCDSEKLAYEVFLELERQLESLPRAEIAREAINARSAIIITESMDEAVECANLIAPEHLEIHMAEPFEPLDKIQNAGSIFRQLFAGGAGDYFAGPNHTLPTMGTARFASPLSVDDFIKKAATHITAGMLCGWRRIKLRLLPEWRALKPTPEASRPDLRWTNEPFSDRKITKPYTLHPR